MTSVLSRRELLAGSSALALAKAATPTKIIDTHTHFYDPSRPQGVPWPGKNDSLLYRTVLPKHLREVSRGLGITGTVVVEASPLLEDNQWILDLAKDEPMIVGFVGNLKPGTPEFRDHLARFGKNRLFLGIRVGERALAEGVGQTAFVDDMKRMAGANLELDALGGQKMLASVVRLCDQVSSLRIVVDHLPFDPPKDESAFRELAKRPQVFIKVSNVLRRNGDPASYRQALDDLWTTFGPDRLVYGSNWPVSEKVGTYAEVFKVVASFFTEKGEVAMEKYFRRNSMAAYRWVERS